MNIAIYTRISEDDERQGKGVARQAKDCRSLVTRLAWTGDVTMYEENDTSATRSKRPTFERLMTDARQGNIDAIAFWTPTGSPDPRERPKTSSTLWRRAASRSLASTVTISRVPTGR